jgi:hypothetical protein
MADNVIDNPSVTLEAEVMDLAARLFDCARSGDAAMLAAYVDAGVPVNLTNTNGDTLVMLASYYGHDCAVAALIARGADVDRSPSALETARFFEREELARQLDHSLRRAADTTSRKTRLAPVESWPEANHRSSLCGRKPFNYDL